MATLAQAQRAIRKQGHFYARGKQDRNACVSVAFNGSCITVSAELSEITERQMERALGKLFPKREFVFQHDRRFGYLYARTK
jgi:hypothetical protein